MHRKVCDGDGTADGVERDVDTAPVGRVEHGVGEVVDPVVDRHVGTEITAELHLLVGAGGRDHARARVHAELHRRGADATRRRMHQHGLPALQSAALEEREPGEVEREVDRRRGRDVEVVGHRERHHRRRDHRFRVTAVRAGRRRDHSSTEP